MIGEIVVAEIDATSMTVGIVEMTVGIAGMTAAATVEMTAAAIVEMTAAATVEMTDAERPRRLQIWRITTSRSFPRCNVDASLAVDRAV